MYSYQGGSSVEVFTASGNPSMIFSNCKLSSTANIQRVYAKELKTYCCQVAKNSSFSIPKNDRQSAQLVHPVCVFQLLLEPNDSLTMDLGLSDSLGGRRRVIMSTANKEVKITPLHIMMPLMITERGMWTNLVLMLSDMISRAYNGTIFKSLDSISFHGTFKLRRIFTLKQFFVLEDVPSKLDFNKDISVNTTIVSLPEPKEPAPLSPPMRAMPVKKLKSPIKRASVPPVVDKKAVASAAPAAEKKPFKRIESAKKPKEKPVVKPKSPEKQSRPHTAVSSCKSDYNPSKYQQETFESDQFQVHFVKLEEHVVDEALIPDETSMKTRKPFIQMKSDDTLVEDAETNDQDNLATLQDEIDEFLRARQDPVVESASVDEPAVADALLDEPVVEKEEQINQSITNESNAEAEQVNIAVQSALESLSLAVKMSNSSTAQDFFMEPTSGTPDLDAALESTTSATVDAALESTTSAGVEVEAQAGPTTNARLEAEDEAQIEAKVETAVEEHVPLSQQYSYFRPSFDESVLECSSSDESIELVYDEQKNCFYDPNTMKYYKINDDE